VTEPLVSHYLRFVRDPARFERELLGPVLMVEPPAQELGNLVERTLQTLSAANQLGRNRNEPVIFEIKKTREQAFLRGITVGRTMNNDVVLDDPSVSRFHAWFALESPQGHWLVHDAGSKNGTVVDGTTLEAKKPYELRGPAAILFGSVEARFLPPRSFLELLRARATAQK
jgi:pSer/pThr/pTyr-binding forkhead associated (FHA) protein